MNAFNAFTVASLAIASMPADVDEAADASDPASQFIDSSITSP